MFSTIFCGKQDPDHQITVVGYGTTLLGVDYWVYINEYTNENLTFFQTTD